MGTEEPISGQIELGEHNVTVSYYEQNQVASKLDVSDSCYFHQCDPYTSLEPPVLEQIISAGLKASG